MKKGKKDLIHGLKPLSRETKMPQFFDTMWDIKWGFQIYDNLFGILHKEALYTALAEHGFDAESVRKWRKSVID